MAEESDGVVRRFEGPIVATAADGSALVLRDSGVDVLSSTLERLATLPIGGRDEDGVAYAVAPGAMHVATVDRSGWVKLWDRSTEIARLDPGRQLASTWEQPLSGPAPETASSWGAPRFLTARILATHHARGVVLWDVDTRTARCTLTDPALFIARESFALGDGRAAVRSSSDTPAVSNATLIEFSTADCSVLHRHLVPPARELVAATASGSTRFVISMRGIRVFDAARVRELAFATDDLMPQAIHASEEGRLVVWAARGKEIVVRLWDREAGRLATIARLAADDHVLHLRADGPWLYALCSSGTVWRWLLPGASEPARDREVTRDELAYEEAVVQLGLGDIAGSLRALERMRPAGETRFVRAYVQSLAAAQPVDAFRARVRAEGIAFAGEPTTLDAAAFLASAEVVGPALDLFLYWLEGVSPGSGPALGADLGLELSLQLSEADQLETQAVLLRRLLEVYPDNEAVRDEAEG